MDAGDIVVEIGPGRGALTRHLVETAHKVVAVEVDPGLSQQLRQRCGEPSNLEVLCGDVLKVRLAELFGKSCPSHCTVVGNLPYYITSPILRLVFASSRVLRSATFLVQDEVADRVVAQPGTRSFGYLSCLCQLHARPKKLFTVEPGAFRPPPRVRSALVRFHMRSDGPREAQLAFLRACFRSPRKTLRNNLAGHYPRRQLLADPVTRFRAQQLDLGELMAIWERLKN